MIREVFNSIAIKLGFIVDPTVEPNFRNQARKRNFSIFIALIIHLISAPYLWGTACLIQGGIGVPCPTCGTTRAIEALIQGEIKEALSWHPLVFLSLFIVIIAVIYSINKEIKKQREFQANEKWRTIKNGNALKYVFIPVLMIYFIVYLIRIINLYPNPPLNYNSDSALGRIIGLFREYLFNNQ